MAECPSKSSAQQTVQHDEAIREDEAKQTQATPADWPRERMSGRCITAETVAVAEADESHELSVCSAVLFQLSGTTRQLVISIGSGHGVLLKSVATAGEDHRLTKPPNEYRLSLVPPKPEVVSILRFVSVLLLLAIGPLCIALRHCQCMQRA